MPKRAESCTTVREVNRSDLLVMPLTLHGEAGSIPAGTTRKWPLGGSSRRRAVCPTGCSVIAGTSALIIAPSAPASKLGISRGGISRTAGNLRLSRSLRRQRTHGCSRIRPGLSSAAHRCNPTRRRCGYVCVRQGFPVWRSDMACDLLRGARRSCRPQLCGVVEDQGEGDAFAGSYGRDSVPYRCCRPPALGLDGTVSGGEHVAMTLRQ